MASFYDTTISQQVEFQRVLASAGFTDSDIARIIKEPSLASTMYASIQPKQTSVPYIIARVERQLARYAEAGFVATDEQRQRILAQAEAFVPLSATDRPLVTGFFDSTPEASESQPLRFADGMQPPNHGPRLVHFDPNT